MAKTLIKASAEFDTKSSGLYYKPKTIVKDDSRVITRLETSLTDYARVVIYDRHMFIVQATASGNEQHSSIEIIGYNIERANMHCQGIACTRTLDVGLTSAKSQKLECFK